MTTPEKTWTEEQLANYECAVETIGNVIAIKARRIQEEIEKPTPNQTTIDSLRRQQNELALERSRLRLEDCDGIARATEQYGKIVRNGA